MTNDMAIALPECEFLPKHRKAFGISLQAVYNKIPELVSGDLQTQLRSDSKPRVKINRPTLVPDIELSAVLIEPSYVLLIAGRDFEHEMADQKHILNSDSRRF